MAAKLSALRSGVKQPFSFTESVLVALASGVARAEFKPNFDAALAWLLIVASTTLFAALLHGSKAFLGVLVTHNSPLDATFGDQL